MPRYEASMNEESGRPLPEQACPKCKGAGYLRADAPFGHPQFGKPILCTCKKNELAEKRRHQLYELSQLRALRDKRFACFNKRVLGVQEAYKAARKFAQNPINWLLLVGKNGCGKTHLAAAVANECLDRGMTVLFTTAPDLLDHLRATFAPTSDVTYDALFSYMREADLLVIDDLGAENATSWAGEKLFQLLNHRYINRLPMVITINETALEAVDKRISSRLMDKSLVEEVTFPGVQDYRPSNTGA